MICPFCSEDMHEGFLSCARKYVVWNPCPNISEYPLEEKGGFLIPMDRVKYDGTYYTVTYFCETCGFVLTPIKMEEIKSKQNVLSRFRKKFPVFFSETHKEE